MTVTTDDAPMNMQEMHKHITKIADECRRLANALLVIQQLRQEKYEVS